MNNCQRYCRHTVWTLLGIFLALASELYAQDQKIGYVDTDTILSNIPEYRGIDQQLRLLSQEWKEELDSMDSEIERLKEDFEAREILYTEDVRKQKQEEIRQLVRRREQYMEQKFGSDGEYYQRQRELLEPIQRKVFDAINTVARSGGYDFVFDRAANTSMLFFRQEWNLNDEVLLELGIDPDEASN